MQGKLKPIPSYRGDLRSVAQTRKRHHDELVVVDHSERIKVDPAYYRRGLSGAYPILLVRAGTHEALRRAADSLPAGLAILVWDGLRTLETQWVIGKEFVSAMPTDQADPEGHTLIARYVSPVPESDSEFHSAPPPHTTGGAVDVTLADAHGQPLDLGADFDQFDESAWLRHYEPDGRGAASNQDKDRGELRRILYWSMVGAGFAPYPWEFWHYEFRTPRAAAFHQKSLAVYGPAVPFRKFREVS